MISDGNRRRAWERGACKPKCADLLDRLLGMRPVIEFNWHRAAPQERSLGIRIALGKVRRQKFHDRARAKKGGLPIASWNAETRRVRVFQDQSGPHPTDGHDVLPLPLSPGDVKDLLHVRAVGLSHEMVRSWCPTSLDPAVWSLRRTRGTHIALR